ncbi:MAG: beta strand repeat-containing protein [Caulobacteraceae bacterium]
MPTTITVTGDYVVPSTDDVTLDSGASTDYRPYTLQIIPPIYAMSFSDNGAVHITSSEDNGAVEGLWDTSTFPAYHTDTIDVAAGGVFSVSAMGSASVAYGFYGSTGELGVFFTNDGTFTVSGAHLAQGAYVGGGGSFANNGGFTVSGGDSASALYMGYGGSFTNTGQFIVSAAQADGVYFGSGAANILNTGTVAVTSSAGGVSGFTLDQISSGSFVNTGTITVTRDAGTWLAINIVGVDDAAAPYAITNSGSITGIVYAVSNHPTRIDVTNTGTMDGGIALNSVPLTTHASSGYDNEIHNSGTIVGDVYLSANGNDLYDGRGGTLPWAIILGGGNKTIFLGDEGENVWTSQHGATGHITGGAGNDYIELDPSDGSFVVNGGGGNDFVWGGGGDDIIDGGTGSDTLWGGGGINTVTHASATAGVTVSLALQQPSLALGNSGQQTGVGNESLAQFQNLTGSAFADTLTGDANDNVLTGGAGADTFVFTAGADIVTDFSQAQGDKIDLTAFTNLHSLADVQAVAAQNGADTVISPRGGGSLTLSGVQLSSLTSLDVVLPAAPHINYDMNGDGAADLLFRDQVTGDWGVAALSASGFAWTDLGRSHASGFAYNEIGPDLPDWAVGGFGDFGGGGGTEVIFRNSATGDWGMSYVSPTGYSWNELGPSTPSYSIDGTGDFNGDGTADVIFRNHITGDWGYAAMGWNGSAAFTWTPLGPSTPSYAIAGTGDFNGDGTSDIIFRDPATGDWGLAAMNRSGGFSWRDIGVTSAAYAIDGTGDFNGDGVADIIFRDHSTGDWGYAAMHRNGGLTWVPLGASTPSYSIDGTGDFNGDGVADVIFRNHATGDWGYASMHANGTFDWLPLGPSSTAYLIA